MHSLLNVIPPVYLIISIFIYINMWKPKTECS